MFFSRAVRLLPRVCGITTPLGVSKSILSRSRSTMLHTRIFGLPIPSLKCARLFSMTVETADQLLKRINDCGINDSAKEAIIDQAAKSKNFAALRDLGEKFMEKKDTQELGVLCFLSGADAGDIESQFAIGNLYFQRYFENKMKPDGDMIVMNDLLDKCKYWYKMAGQNNHLLSEVALAKVLLEDPTQANVQQALGIYEKANMKDCTDAIYNLGFIHYEGMYDQPVDRVKGYQYLHKAADLNDISSCYFIGYAYHKGLYENDNPNSLSPSFSEAGKGGKRLCEQDLDKAMKYLMKACEGGHSKAMVYVSLMYRNGEGVAKDDETSLRFLDHAMRLGDPEALFIKANMYYSGEGITKDLKRALTLFIEAGERGSADAMCSAGAMVYKGEGQEKDLTKAFDLYTKAAGLGSLPALKNIASMYMLGEGVPKDPNTANNLLKFIAEEEKKMGANPS